MNKINNNRLPFIRLYNTIDILINKHGYNMYVTKDALYKEIKPKRLKIEIDALSGDITAYKKGLSYLSRWKQVKVRHRWIKELDYLTYPIINV